MIKYSNAIPLCILVMASMGCEPDEKSFRPQLRSSMGELTVEDLNGKTIIGKLGMPLGSPAVIKAVIVDGETMKDKIHSESYLLAVIEVNGSLLQDKPVLEFSLNHSLDVELAVDNIELINMFGEGDDLSEEYVNGLKKKYVGKEVSLLVYETGHFSGVPNDLPDNALLWQDEGFNFKSTLEVLLEAVPMNQGTHKPSPQNDNNPLEGDGE